MDQAKLTNKKLEGSIRRAIDNGSTNPMKVIVQTKDGLKEEDQRLVSGLGGKIIDNLWIINAYSAELTPKAIEMMILSDRIVRIFPDSEVHN